MNSANAELPASNLARRSGVAILWFAMWSVVGLVAYASAGYREVFIQLQMTDLPAPTLAVLAMGSFFRSVPGLGVAVAAFASGLLLIRRGCLDGRLGAASGVLAAAMVLLIGLSYLGLHRPFQIITKCLSGS